MSEPAARFRRLIEGDGPLPIARFMAESNALYYASRDPLGVAGDFITAPEISQMFGELIGLWAADLWHRAGRPEPVMYAELGPGRGTLARDALRAMGAAGLHPPVHFVEGSPVLAAAALDAVGGEAVVHASLADLPRDGALLLVANEFLDALPIHQLVRTEGGWREMAVGLDAHGGFVLVAGDRPMEAAVPPERRDAPAGTVIETCPAAHAIVAEIAQRLLVQGGAALLIDYGHTALRAGSTLQAVRAHQRVEPLACPGEADLTAHVDFAALAETARQEGVQVSLTTQGRFLEALSIAARTEALARRNAAARPALEAARRRLCDRGEMGNLFKVMALAAPGWPPVAGFGAEAFPKE